MDDSTCNSMTKSVSEDCATSTDDTNKSYSDTNYVFKVDLDTQTILITANTIVSCWLINIVGVFGIFGNTLSILILRRHGMKDVTNIILMSLTVFDLVYVVTSVVIQSACFVSNFDAETGVILSAYVTKYLYVSNRVIGHIAATHIGFISIERLLAVYLPFKVSILITKQRVGLSIVIICIVWIVPTSPFLMMFEVSRTNQDTFNRTVLRVVYAEYVLQNFDTIVGVNLLLAFMKGPLLFAIIFICSVCISVKLRAAGKKRLKAMKTTSRSHLKYDDRAVKMLLTVCMSYLVLTFPTLIPTIIYVIRPDITHPNGQASKLSDLLEKLTDLLFVVNSSVNFIIYVTMSKKFYITYKQLFGVCCDKNASE